MRGERYGHSTEADPRNVHPVVIVGEQTPLLRSDAGGSHGTPTPDDEETTVILEDVPLSRVVLIIGSCWLGAFLATADGTVVSTLSGPIASDFDSLSIMSWLATAYFISCAALQPILGRLTDIFGRGPGLVLSNLLFAAGNLLCGLSPSSSVLIAGRVVAGLGGGGLMCITTFVSSDLIPLRRRGMVQGLNNVFAGMGMMSGGVIGGILNDHTALGWRLAFLLMVPPAVVSAVLAALLVRIPPKQSDRSYLSRIDFAGVALIISALVLLLIGLGAGGNLVPWRHPLPMTAIPAAFVLCALFAWWEARTRYPVMPLAIMRERTVLAACLCNFFCTMVAMAYLFYLPLYLQVRGDSATTAAVKMLPTPVGGSLGSLAVGYCLTRTGRYMAPTIVSMLALMAGLVLFALQSEDSPEWMTLAAVFFTGGGYGSMLTATLLACIAAVEHSQQAVVTSATYLYRSVGNSLGITLASAVYQNVLNARLWAKFGAEPDAADVIRRIRDDLGELKHLPEGWYDGVIRCFVEAFQAVWLSLLALAVVGFVSVCFMQQHKLHSTLARR